LLAPITVHRAPPTRYFDFSQPDDEPVLPDDELVLPDDEAIPARTPMITTATITSTNVIRGSHASA